MKTINAKTTDWRVVYKRLTELVQPRPIALVSTLSADGQPNLAPFSFYNVISCNPPLIAFAPQISGRTGEKKDTLKNIEAHPEFVVAVVTQQIAEQVNAASAPLPYGDSEFEHAQLTPVPAPHIKGNLIKESPVNMECELVDIHRYGSEGGSGHLVVARVNYLHIAEAVLQGENIDPGLLDAVGRMGGEDWCTTEKRFSFSRPDRGGK